MQVPEFLLRRLYVNGSLRSVDGGFAFDLKNSLGSGYAEEVLPLTLDGDELPMASTRFDADGETTRFDEVSGARPMTLGMDRTVTISVDGRALMPGKHKLGIGFVVAGMGTLQFDVTDIIDGADDAG